MRVCQMPEKDCYVEHLRRTHTKTMIKLKPRVEDMWSRTLTINGFSKAFSMTGHLSCTETLWSTLHLSNCSILPFCSYCLPQNCTVISTHIASCCTLTGYRLGYLAAQKDIVKAVSKLQSQFLGSFGVLVLESLRWFPVLYSKHISNTLRGRALKKLQKVSGPTLPSLYILYTVPIILWASEHIRVFVPVNFR